jgi:UDP-N-acetylmuramoyl-tripeptide--D-alanyl-D-alanine ligase
MKDFFKKIIIAILTLEAKLVLKKYKPKIVAITGSVGKTSTKDAIYTVLKSHVTVRKSQKSFNSEFGVPLTILNLPSAWNSPIGWIKNILKGLKPILVRQKYPEWLVLEVGVEHPGDIEKLTRWVRPDIAVIKRFPRVPVHVEYFKSPEEVQHEKSYVARRLKESGTLILNADDALVLALKQHPHKQLITFGKKDDATMRLVRQEYIYSSENTFRTPIGISFVVSHKGTELPCTVKGTVGHHFVYPSLAALAVGVAVGMNLRDAITALQDHEPTKGRMRIHRGIRNTVLIDDSYNSSPIALKEALVTLKELNVPHRRIAVLGDMLELGEFSPEEHKKAGAFAAGIADVLVTVGVRARGLAQAARESGMSGKQVYEYLDSREAGAFIKQLLEPGDTVLVKGSQSIRTERIVAMLLAEPEHAQELLVRQEKEWMKR